MTRAGPRPDPCSPNDKRGHPAAYLPPKAKRPARAGGSPLNRSNAALFGVHLRPRRARPDGCAEVARVVALRINVDPIRAEKESGASRDGRTEQGTILGFLWPNGEMVVARLDRLGRNTLDALSMGTKPIRGAPLSRCSMRRDAQGPAFTDIRPDGGLD